LVKVQRLFSALVLFFCGATVASAQSTHGFPYRATNYNVEVLLHPDDQTISALVKVDFVGREVSKTLTVELHPDLKVNSIRAASGPPLNFERDGSNPLLVRVALPETGTPGKQVTLTFDYTGPVSNPEDSPTKGVRFASVEKASAYLLLPARWFPLTDYPSNRYTGTFKIVAPDSFAVVGTGKADPPTMLPGIGKGVAGQATYVFHCDRPAPVGSFVAGSLQLTPVQTEGFNVSVYTPPAQASTANSFANSLAHILTYFTDTFGALEGEQVWTIAQLPDGTLQGFSAPGLLLISARQWTARANERVLARIAAGEWWDDRIMVASREDVWLRDGLSRYAEAMYAEQSDGSAGLHKALEDFAVGALMYEDTSTIAQAQRLQPYSDAYRSVVEDKGAMVFHMLRTEIGNDAFESLLKEFYKRYDGKTVTISEFEKMAATKVSPPAKGDPPVNLTAFFSQWLNSTGIPEFKLTYIVYRTAKGFKVVGKVTQDLDTFRMPVEMRVETEGNPELKKILVTGTSSDFLLDTFGRPKPNGITIDPNNNLLKSSPRLRVHASIARGEGYAEIGKFYEAIQEYQHALDVQPTSSLADFRMGEAMFYQKNNQAAANAFRAALGGDLDPKWVEVWSHIYIGKIYDLLDQRARAVNEYQLAQHTNDDTAGAQQEITRLMQKSYAGDNATASAAPSDTQPPTAAPAPAAPSGVTLKRRTDNN
jgi:aminopeptidase N